MEERHTVYWQGRGGTMLRADAPRVPCIQIGRDVRVIDYKNKTYDGNNPLPSRFMQARGSEVLIFGDGKIVERIPGVAADA